MKPPNPLPGERLQKVLANAGMGSRREIEGWISAGLVEVNGQPARLGQRVGPEDSIRVRGHRVSHQRLEPPLREVLVYNKPEGELVTRKDPEGRRTVFDHLPKLKHGRWIPVGRLDLNTSGLLLLTTDGELANQLMHPSRQVEREYAVRVMGEVSEAQLEQLVNGVELEDGPARFEEIVSSGGEGINRWYHVVIMEGRQREVRRIWEAVGAKVSRLKRVRYGSVMLEAPLKVGRWRYLSEDEIDALMVTLGLKADKPKGRGGRAAAASRPKPPSGTGAKPVRGRAPPAERRRKGEERGSSPKAKAKAKREGTSAKGPWTNSRPGGRRSR